MINLGDKYQHLVQDPNCSCCARVDWGLPNTSRRRFLATSAFAALPVAFGVGAASAAASDAPAGNVSTALARTVSTVVDGDSARLTALFKDIHQNPELGFMEVRTAKIVADELAKLGFDVKTGIGVTGVVGVLRNGDGPVVMDRADMDANAVEERTGFDYASKAGAARRRRRGAGRPYVRSRRSRDLDAGHGESHGRQQVRMARNAGAGWPACSAHHGGQGDGRRRALRQAWRAGPEPFFGMHTAPGPVGMVACAGGVRMAGTEQLDVVFHGVGGHGSMPHLTKDPIMMAVAAAMEYQIMLARTIDPQETAVLTIGSIQAGTENDVIPEFALLNARTCATSTLRCASTCSRGSTRSTITPPGPTACPRISCRA